LNPTQKRERIASVICEAWNKISGTTVYNSFNKIYELMRENNSDKDVASDNEELPEYEGREEHAQIQS